MDQPSIAVYFQDMTPYLKQLRLESQILTEKNYAENLESYTATISHEFRTPISISLMFIESVLGQIQDSEQANKLKLVVANLNLLLSLVHDVLDLKVIESGKFERNNSVFSPIDTLQFIKSMFQA